MKDRKHNSPRYLRATAEVVGWQMELELELEGACWASTEVQDGRREGEYRHCGVDGVLVGIEGANVIFFNHEFSLVQVCLE